MNPIDLSQIAETYGPLVAFMVAALIAMGWVIRALWARLNDQIDGRMSDHKLHATQLAEGTKMLDQARQFIEGQHRG